MNKLIDGQINQSCKPDRLATASSKVLTLTYPPGTVKREYKLANEDCQPYNGPITITSNVYVYESFSALVGVGIDLEQSKGGVTGESDISRESILKR